MIREQVNDRMFVFIRSAGTRSPRRKDRPGNPTVASPARRSGWKASTDCEREFTHRRRTKGERCPRSGFQGRQPVGSERSGQALSEFRGPLGVRQNSSEGRQGSRSGGSGAEARRGKMNNFRGTSPRSPRLRATPSVALFGEASWTPNTVRSRHFPSVEDFRLTPKPIGTYGVRVNIRPIWREK